MQLVTPLIEDAPTVKAVGAYTGPDNSVYFSYYLTQIRDLMEFYHSFAQDHRGTELGDIATRIKDGLLKAIPPSEEDLFTEIKSPDQPPRRNEATGKIRMEDAILSSDALAERFFPAPL